MAEPAELAGLKDIHLPQSIHWWPLAPGWYVIVFGTALLVLGLGYSLYKRSLNAQPKKQALRLLDTYSQYYEKINNSQLTSARISELLRRVALVYFPREQVAGLYGQDWVEFLNQTSKGIDFKSVQNMLLDSPFKTPEEINLKPLITRARLWIKQRRGPCLN
ncbi:MAG: DUF4381 domain-containing protein [Legionellales bacterium]